MFQWVFYLSKITEIVYNYYKTGKNPNCYFPLGDLTSSESSSLNLGNEMSCQGPGFTSLRSEATHCVIQRAEAIIYFILNKNFNYTMWIYIYNWIWSKHGKLGMTSFSWSMFYLKIILKSHLDCIAMHLKCRKHYICYWKMNISVLLFCIYFGHWKWMGSCRKTRCCHSFSHLIRELNTYTWTAEEKSRTDLNTPVQHNSWTESSALGFPALCTKRGVLPLITLGAELNMSTLWTCKMRHGLVVIQQNTSCGGLALADS